MSHFPPCCDKTHDGSNLRKALLCLVPDGLSPPWPEVGVVAGGLHLCHQELKGEWFTWHPPWEYRVQTGTRNWYKLQGPLPCDLLPQARPHLRKIPQASK